MGEKADIIEHNLELMFSAKRGGMRYQIEKESYGGRGHVVIRGIKYPLIYSNFCYDPLTGFIHGFTRFASDAPKGYVMGVFQIAFAEKAGADPNYNPFFRIVGMTLDDATSEEAGAILQNCAAMYNDVFDKQ